MITHLNIAVIDRGSAASAGPGERGCDVVTVKSLAVDLGLVFPPTTGFTGGTKSAIDIPKAPECRHRRL